MTAAATTNPRTLWLGYAACALAGSLWGTGFYFGRLALNEMPVEYMVLFRFLFASLALLPAVLRSRIRFTVSQARLLLVCAALGVPVQFLVQFHGLARTTVSHASLMVGSMPVLLAIAAAFFAGERLDKLGWAAVCASSIGVVLIVLGGTPSRAAHGAPSLTGDLLVLASMATAIVWTLQSKKLMQTNSPLAVSGTTILAGTAMLAFCVAGQSLLDPLRFPAPNLGRISPTAWMALLVSGLFCTAATTLLWNWGIHHVPASRAGVFLNLEPALGSWLGVQLLGEQLGPHAGVGGLLILVSAIVLTTRTRQPEPELLLE